MPPAKRSSVAKTPPRPWEEQQRKVSPEQRKLLLLETMKSTRKLAKQVSPDEPKGESFRITSARGSMARGSMAKAKSERKPKQQSQRKLRTQDSLRVISPTLSKRQGKSARDVLGRKPAAPLPERKRIKTEEEEEKEEEEATKSTDAVFRLQRRAAAQEAAANEERAADADIVRETTFTKLVKRLKRKVTLRNVKLRRTDAVEMSEALALTQRQLRRLYDGFDSMDLDGSGYIQAIEFLEALDEPRTTLTMALFTSLDLNKDAMIDFEAYVAVSLVYSMYTKDAVLKFCFDLFDKNHSGEIDEEEFLALAAEINTDPMFPGNYASALATFDTNDDGLIDFEEFKQLDRRYPLLLYPAFRMQNSLQQLTLGLSGWNSVMRNVEYNFQRREHPEKKDKTPRWMRCLFPHPLVDLEFLDTKSPIPRFTLDDEEAAALSPQLAVEAGADSETAHVAATSTSSLGKGEDDDAAAHNRRGSRKTSSSSSSSSSL